MTGGKGVDLIFDPVGASNFEFNSKSVGLDCRWVLYGTMGGVKVPEADLRLLLGKRV